MRKTPATKLCNYDGNGLIRKAKWGKKRKLSPRHIEWYSQSAIVEIPHVLHTKNRRKKGQLPIKY